MKAAARVPVRTPPERAAAAQARPAPAAPRPAAHVRAALAVHAAAPRPSRGSIQAKPSPGTARIIAPPTPAQPSGRAPVAPARAGVVQPALLALTQTNLQEHRAAVTAALRAQGIKNRGITLSVARQIVAAHPPVPEDQNVYGYISANEGALTAEGFDYRPYETENLTRALDQYREQQEAIRAQQQLLRQAALERLAPFITAASAGPMAAITAHVFEGEINGEHKPKGLHAYTNGSLPPGVQVLKTFGSTDNVHVIVWTHATARSGATRYCKWSTMFPIDMPKGMVCWYLLNRRHPDDYPPHQRPDVAPFLWRAITVGQSGATNYPDYPGGEAAVRLLFANAADLHYNVVGTTRTITVAGIDYRVDN